jgi:hypothetical protein
MIHKKPCIYRAFSYQNIKEFSEQEFDNFYGAWLQETLRDNTMDEYGQLIFILGQASSWNKQPHKIILHEKAEPLMQSCQTQDVRQ